MITYGELFINKYQKTRSAEDINTALKYFDTFMKIRQQYIEQDSSDDKEHFEIGLAGINRAYFKLYFEIGEYDKAEYYLQQFENELQKYTLNKNIDSTADSASLFRNYGELRYARGEYSAAINDLLAARRLYELYFSNKYPRIVHALERLSQCYMKLNMYREAEVSISEAVEIARALYTDDHPLLNELIVQKHCIEEKL